MESIYEIIMLVCFGIAWPVSIAKSWFSRQNKGKSVIFLYIVFLGYVAGVMHKSFYSFDKVIFLYILNGLMVLLDILIYYRNKKIALKLVSQDPQ